MHQRNLCTSGVSLLHPGRVIQGAASCVAIAHEPDCCFEPRAALSPSSDDSCEMDEKRESARLEPPVPRSSSSPTGCAAMTHERARQLPFPEAAVSPPDALASWSGGRT
jgi:hypothetical protein